MAGGAYRLDEVAVRLDGGAGGTDVPLPVAVVSGGTGADLSTIAKGGLLVGTGAGTIGIKGVGTNGQVLTADSTAAGGTKWSTGSGITNSAPANVLAKGDAGGNLVASSVTDDGTTLTLGTAKATVTEASGTLTLASGTITGATAPLAITQTWNAAGTTFPGATITVTDTASALGSSMLSVKKGTATQLAVLNGGTGVLGPAVVVPAGVLNSPGLSFGSANAGLYGGTGLYSATNGRLMYGGGSTVEIGLTTSGLSVGSGGYIGFAPGSPDNTNWDVFIRRKAAANPAWGLASATPVAYVHNLAADGSGTNIAGANATIAPGIGSGDATGSSLIVQTPTPVASGTGAQTPTTRLTINATGIIPATNLRMPFGAIYWATPAATANEANTPILAAGTTAAQGSAYEVTQATTNRLTYTGATTRNFLVTATMSVSAAATNTLSTLYIYKGGSAVTGLSIARYITGSDTGAVAIHGVVSLATNEFVELYCATDDGDNLTMNSGVLSIRALD